MAKFTKVPIKNFSIWKKKNRDLSHNAKLVYFFLYTSEITGIFELPRMEKLGLADNQVLTGIKDLQQRNLIYVDWNSETVLIPEMFSHQKPVGKLSIKGTISYLSQIEDFDNWQYLYDIIIDLKYPQEVILFVKSKINKKKKIASQQINQSIEPKIPMLIVDEVDVISEYPKKEEFPEWRQRAEKLRKVTDIVVKYIDFFHQQHGDTADAGNKEQAVRLIITGTQYKTPILDGFTVEDLESAVLGYFNTKQNRRYKVNNFFANDHFKRFISIQPVKEDKINSQEYFDIHTIMFNKLDFSLQKMMGRDYIRIKGFTAKKNVNSNLVLITVQEQHNKTWLENNKFDIKIKRIFQRISDENYEIKFDNIE